MEVRTATPKDAEALLGIYTPYVENTAVSFEYTMPTISEFRKRIENILTEYPYLAAVENGKVLGYAYASRFHEREAYSHTAEVSIYVDRSMRRKGIGKMLYSELEKILVKQNVFILYACIALSEHEDEHLNDDSIEFHKRMGYRTVGKHELCGYKFGKWYSMIWMEKVIAQREENPHRFIRFADLNEQ